MKTTILHPFRMLAVFSFVALQLWAAAADAQARSLRTWLICGPFGDAIETDYLGGEANGAPVLGRTSGGKTWKQWSSMEAAVSLIDPNAMGTYNNANAYAFIEINSPAQKEQLARLLLGSDDGVKVWFNGKCILTNDIPRGCIIDEDKLIVKLKPGKNRLLLKIRNIGGGWSFSATITGMNGKNIEGLTFKPAQEDLARIPVTKIIYSGIQGNDIKQFSPAFLIDGNELTRWSSGFSNEENVVFDLGEPQTLTRIALLWENAFASSYSFQTSNDGLQWKDAYLATNGKGGREDIRLQAPVKARFLKINFLKRATDWGNSLFEVYLFGRASREYPADYYAKSLKNLVVEKSKGVKQPLEISMYPREVGAGTDISVDVEWSNAPSDKDYKLIVQFENWDLSPGVCHVVTVDKFSERGKRTVKVNVPNNTPKIEGYRFVAAFISRSKNWDDTKMVITTEKDVEVTE